MQVERNPYQPPEAPMGDPINGWRESPFAVAVEVVAYSVGGLGMMFVFGLVCWMLTSLIGTP